MLKQLNASVRVRQLFTVFTRFKSTDNYPVIGTEQNRNSKQFAVCIPFDDV